MDRPEHFINGIKCSVELAKSDIDEEPLKLESRRLFVSYFPLDRLTSKELKNTFGAYGKITDVEFVSVSDKEIMKKISKKNLKPKNNLFLIFKNSWKKFIKKFFSHF